MLDALLDDGWSYHDRESERLARELEAAAAAVDAAEIDRFLHLANHTLGEHLADWPRARRLAERVMRDRAASAETVRAWSRLALARLMDGDPAAAMAAELAGQAAAADPLAAMIEARFLLVAALVGSKRAAEAATIYEAALALARQVGDAAPARAIAIASNNLAAELLEAASRSADETALMQAAAEAAHVYWKRAGTWVNEERALYLKALVAGALARPAEALAHADAALAIIADNGEAPIDATFPEAREEQGAAPAGRRRRQRGRIGGGRRRRRRLG